MNFVVVGGGPAGVEVTANLWRLINQNGGNAAIKLIAGGGFWEASLKRSALYPSPL